MCAAAKIIRAEIRERIYDAKSYPTNEDIANVNKGKEWISHYLQTFLKIIIQSELQVLVILLYSLLGQDQL